MSCNIAFKHLLVEMHQPTCFGLAQVAQKHDVCNRDGAFKSTTLAAFDVELDDENNFFLSDDKVPQRALARTLLTSSPAHNKTYVSCSSCSSRTVALLRPPSLQGFFEAHPGTVHKWGASGMCKGSDCIARSCHRMHFQAGYQSDGYADKLPTLQPFQKMNASTRYMPPWSLEELQAARSIFPSCKDDDTLHARYRLWGGSILYCLARPSGPDSDALLYNAVRTVSVEAMLHMVDSNIGHCDVCPLLIFDSFKC